MPYRLALFDFDGTLADSFPFFLRSFDELAVKHGFARVDPARIDEYRHFGAREMMREVGLPAWKMPLVAKDFIGLMRQHAAEIRVFEGVAEALAELSARGVILTVVSSNSEENVRTVLGPTTSALIRQFDCGMSMFGKTARIGKVLRDCRVPAAEAIYIGDQTVDHDAARKAGVAFGAVAWGYAAIEALRAQAPEDIFIRVDDLRRIAAGA
jgi:phosphoglycolate phosphatase